MDNQIKDYKIISDWTPCGNGKYAFAKRGNDEFFVKQLVTPRWPVCGSSDTKEQGIRQCKDFEYQKRNVMEALKRVSLPNGNLLIPYEIFLEGAFYYEVSFRIKDKFLNFEDVSRCNRNNKIMLIKTMMASLALLEKAGVVHGDIKPDNVAVSYSKTSHSLRARIFDMTDSYLVGRPGSRDCVIGTTPYYSPELGKYIVENGRFDVFKKGERSITTKSDVFAAGLVIHQYLAEGRFPKYPQNKFNYPYEAVNHNYKLIIDSSIDTDIAFILAQMLQKRPSERPNPSEIIDMLNEIEKNVS